MRKAYSYKRFSSLEQEKGFSVDRQKDAAELYCEKNGLELVAVYDDLGVSAFRGKNVTGEARLAEFLKDVQGDNRKIPAGSVLIVESMDRLSRQDPMEVVYTIIAPIIYADIEIVTLFPSPKSYTRASIKDGPLAMIELIVMASRAHEESLMKSERGLDNWYRKRKEASSSTLSKRVVGWCTVDVTGTSKRAVRSKPALIPERAKVVQQIYAAFLSGVGQESIARKLNTDGVPCFGKASQWHKSYITKILTNPAVIGTYEAYTLEGRKAKHGPVESIADYYPAVVTEDDYYSVQALLKGHNRKGQKPEIRNVLSTLGTCPLCGATMTRVNKGPRKGQGEYLICTKAKVGNGCAYHLLKYTEVENSLIEGLQELKLSSLKFKGQVSLKKELARVKQSLDRVEQQRQRVIQAISDGTQLESDSVEVVPDGAPVSLVELIRALDTMIEERKEDINRIERNVVLTQEATIKARFSELKKVVAASDLDRAAINAVLIALCSSIVVDYVTERIRLNFRFGEALDLSMSAACQSVRSRITAKSYLANMQGASPEHDPFDPEDSNLI